MVYFNFWSLRYELFYNMQILYWICRVYMYIFRCYDNMNLSYSYV